jgi:hypothetical protein
VPWNVEKKEKAVSLCDSSADMDCVNFNDAYNRKVRCVSQAVLVMGWLVLTAL